MKKTVLLFAVVIITFILAFYGIRYAKQGLAYLDSASAREKTRIETEATWVAGVLFVGIVLFDLLRGGRHG